MTNRASRIAGSDLRAFDMPGRFPQGSMPPPQPSNGVSPALFRRQQLWVKLAAYRPLAVLASIWVALLAIAFLAYGQLIHTSAENNRRSVAPAEVNIVPHERSDNGEATRDAASASTPEVAETRIPDSAVVSARDVDSDTTSPEERVAEVGIGGGTLITLVGTCALGCWLLSLQLKASPKARTRKRMHQKKVPKQPFVNQTSTGQQATPLPSQASTSLQRLDPYAPGQPLVAPTQVRNTSPTSRSPEHKRTTPVDVTVVSPGFEHQLDWPEDSLVNTADMRQRRSLSSYM